MTQVFLVYKTDSHHSYASRDVIGIGTTFFNAIALCKSQAKKEHERLTSDQIFNLSSMKQTQGYTGLGEFQIESLDTNKLF